MYYDLGVIFLFGYLIAFYGDIITFSWMTQSSFLSSYIKIDSSIGTQSDDNAIMKFLIFLFIKLIGSTKNFFRTFK